MAFSLAVFLVGNPNSVTLPRIAFAAIPSTAIITSLSSTEIDGVLHNAFSWKPWNFWRPIGAGPHEIEINFITERDVNSWALAGHDASGLIGCDYWDGANWILFNEYTIVEADGRVRYHHRTSVQTSRLRFRFEAITFVSILWAGVDLELPEGLTAGWEDPDIGLRAKLTHETSRDGVWLGTSVEQWIQQRSISLKH